MIKVTGAQTEACVFSNYPQETATVKWINDETVEISDHTLNVKQAQLKHQAALIYYC